MNTFNGSTAALFDNTGRPLTPKAEHYDSIDRYERYNRYNKHLDLSNGSLHKFGLDESSDWNEPPQIYSTRDSGMVSFNFGSVQNCIGTDLLTGSLTESLSH